MKKLNIIGISLILITFLFVINSCTKDFEEINTNPNDATGRIETAFKAVLATAAVEAKLRHAQKQKHLPKAELLHIIDLALAQGIITANEYHLFLKAEQARFAAISVDDFSNKDL